MSAEKLKGLLGTCLHWISTVWAHLLLSFSISWHNGERYLRVGGTRSRHFDGTTCKPRKSLENAATPTRRVHAVLGCAFFFHGEKDSHKEVLIHTIYVRKTGTLEPTQLIC